MESPADGWSVSSTGLTNLHYDYSVQKIYSHFESNLGFGLTQIDEINPGTTLHVVCPT